MPLGTEVGLGPGDTVRWGLSSPKKGAEQPPTFWPVYCGQMTVWMKMPLKMEVDLGPGYNALDGDPAPLLKRGTAAPSFRPMSVCLLWAFVAKWSPISATAEHLLYYVMMWLHVTGTI